MPKLASPSFNGVNISPDLRRVLEASLRPAAAALNKALVVGDSLQVWGPMLVTGTGAGGGGVTGSGTTGSIPKWTGSTALGDSGATMDGSNRLSVPVGVAFPDGSHIDTAPTLSGSATTNQIAYWSGSNTVAGTANLTISPASGNVTSLGTVAGKKLQVTDSSNPNILNASGSIALTLGTSAQQASVINGTSGIAFRFTNAGAPPTGGIVASFEAGGVNALQVVNNGKLLLPSTDSSGTPGAATINKPSGKSAIAAGASSVVITNSVVTAASEVIVTPLDLDATLTSYKAVPAAGSFTVTGNANATAAWKFSWWVLN